MSIKIQEKKSRTKQQLVRGNALKLTLMVFPMMLVVLVVSYLPMGGMIVAFKNYNYSLGIWGSPFMDPIWKNFSYLFKSPDTYRMLTNTIVYNLAILFLTTILSVTIAMLLNEIRSRNALKVYQTAILHIYQKAASHILEYFQNMYACHSQACHSPLGNPDKCPKLPSWFHQDNRACDSQKNHNNRYSSNQGICL